MWKHANMQISRKFTHMYLSLVVWKSRNLEICMETFTSKLRDAEKGQIK